MREQFVENYPTSLIGEIRFDLEDMGFLDCPCVGLWGEQIRLSFWAGAKGSGISLGLPFPWAWRVGLRAYFLNPIKYY